MKTTWKKNARLWGGSAAILLIGLAVLGHFLIPGLRPLPPAPAPETWPTNGWQITTPEEQGIDSLKLAEGLSTIRAAGIPIHSLMLIRNARVVVEAYFYPYDGQSPHSTASVTKSLMTTLIGIAIGQGKLSLDDHMLSFFPEHTIANLDAHKQAITIRHLASMSAGMECSGPPDELTVQQMEASPDWVQFALDRPMAYAPGTHWEYCGLGMHLLSAILEKATGMPAQEFARINLFEPLGIWDFTWPADPQGVNMGAGNLRLYPADMAKLGLLWLQAGRWDSRQIVPSKWVRQSVMRYFKDGDDSYGFGWWISQGLAGPSYNAVGNGGQRITVDPALNLIVVTTGGGFNFDDVVPYVVPAVVDLEKSLPANPVGDAKLVSVLGTLPQPPGPLTASQLPAIAGQISGKIIHLDSNAFQLESLRLDFNNAAEATVQFGFTDQRPTRIALVGLDGRYRMTPGLDLDRAFHSFADFQNLAVGLRGAWLDGQTFRLEYDTLINRYFYLLELKFDGEHASLQASERGTSASATIEGRLQNP